MTRPHVQPWQHPERPPCGLDGECRAPAGWLLLTPHAVADGPAEWSAVPLCDLDARRWLDATA